MDAGLEKRLAPGDLDPLDAVTVRLAHDVVDRSARPLVERLRRIAPGTAQVARGEPDEHARPAGMGRLALNRAVDLVHHESVTGSARRRAGSGLQDRKTGRSGHGGIVTDRLGALC